MLFHFLESDRSRHRRRRRCFDVNHQRSAFVEIIFVATGSVVSVVSVAVIKDVADGRRGRGQVGLLQQAEEDGRILPGLDRAHQRRSQRRLFDDRRCSSVGRATFKCPSLVQLY